MTAVIRTPVGRYPLAGRCTVCGHQAAGLLIFPGHREVYHQAGGGRPCLIPNPPARVDVAVAP